MKRDLKILSISFSYEKGGAEESLRSLLAELKKKGIKIFLFTSPFLKNFYRKENIEIHLLPFSPSMNLFTKFGKLKIINIYSLLKRVFIVLIYSWKINRFCKKGKIKIIHINDFKGGIFIPFLKFLTRLKIVWHIRDLFAWESKAKKYYYKIFGSFSDLLIANSPLTQKMMEEMGFNNLKMIYNIVNIETKKIDKKEARKKIGIPEDKFLIGYIGRISEEKEIGNLLKSLNILKEKIPDIFCLIVGEDFKGGKEKKKLIEYVENKGLENYTNFAGWQKDLKYYYSAIDILVHPREKTYEPFGRIFIEAMFYGVPILGTNIISWLIKDAENGFIAKNGPEGLAKKIVEIYNKKEILRKVSEKAKEFAKQNFEKEKIITEFKIAFEKLKM